MMAALMRERRNEEQFMKAVKSGRQTTVLIGGAVGHILDFWLARVRDLPRRHHRTPFEPLAHEFAPLSSMRGSGPTAAISGVLSSANRKWSRSRWPAKASAAQLRILGRAAGKKLTQTLAK
jgi:hypothetical protein